MITVTYTVEPGDTLWDIAKFFGITVNDIANKCDINRQTFYYHFQDIRDLIEWICID